MNFAISKDLNQIFIKRMKKRRKKKGNMKAGLILEYQSEVDFQKMSNRQSQK